MSAALRAAARPAAGEGTGALSPAQFWCCFALLLAVALLPLLLVTWPPLLDYPNHLARMFLLADGPGTESLRRYYEVRWQPLPDLAMDLVVPPLAHLIGLDLAGKSFVAATLALIALGAALVQRALGGGWTLWSLFAFLVLYSNILLAGFLNYLFGFGLALLAFALWIALRHRRPALRLALSALLVLVLYFAHLMACAVYGVLVFGFELERWLAQRPRRASGLIWTFAAGLPFLPALAIFLASHYGRLQQVGWQSALYHRDALEKATYLFSLVDNYDFALDLASLLLLGALALWTYGGRYLVLCPGLRLPVVLLVLAFLLGPADLMTAGGVDYRLPATIAVIAAAGTVAARRLPAALLRGAAVLGLALFLVRMGVIAAEWRRADALYRGLVAVLDQVPEGSRLAVAFSPAQIAESDGIAIMHIPALAVIRRHAFVQTLFAYPEQQPIAFVGDAAGLRDPTLSDALWRALIAGDASAAAALETLRRFDAVALVSPEPLPAIPATAPLEPIAAAPNLALYRVRH